MRLFLSVLFKQFMHQYYDKIKYNFHQVIVEALIHSCNIHYIYLHAENFMTGYRVVFDRENMVLGWKESNCEYTSLLPHQNSAFFTLLLH